MTGDCRDSRFEKMIYPYELGLLSPEERREFELHILDCPVCAAKIKGMEPAMDLIRHDSEVRHELDHLALNEETVSDQTAPGPYPLWRRLREHRTLIQLSLIAAAILVILMLGPIKELFSPPSEAIAAANRVAVMYFENLTTGPQSENLGEMITNLIITDLSESNYIQVISGQRLHDILKLLGHPDISTVDRDLASQVAREAQANWILAGSIMEENQTRVIVSQLVDVSKGNVIAAERISGGSDESIFSMVDRLSFQIKKDLSLPAAALQENDLPVSEVTTGSPEAYRLYLKGLDYKDKFYYQDAVRCFETALEYDSTFAMVYYHLAQLKRGDYFEKAVKYSARATRKEQLYIASRQEQKNGNMHAAIDLLIRLTRDFPQEKEAYFLLGQYYRFENETAKAIESYQAALSLDSLYKLPYNELAYLYESTGRLDLSLAALDKYIELAPNEANPYDSKAEILSCHGRLDEAIASYKRALEIRPDYSNSLINLGLLYIYKGEYDKADSCLRLVGAHPSASTRSAARFYLALIPMYQGRLDQTLKVLDYGIAVDSTEQITSGIDSKRLLKAEIYTARLDNLRAFPAIEHAMKAIHDAIPETMGQYIQILTDCSHPDETRPILDSLRKLVENKSASAAEYWYASGYLARARGQNDSALYFFAKAADSMPKYFPIHYMFGISLLENGRAEDAAREFENIQAVYDMTRLYYGLWSVKSHYFLGLAYEKMGEQEKAAAQYTELLRIWEQADIGLDLLIDARQRLTRIKKGS